MRLDNKEYNISIFIYKTYYDVWIRYESPKKMGCCEERYLPYIPNQKVNIGSDSVDILNNAKKYTIKDYYSLFGLGKINIWKFKKAINEYGFAVCGFYLPVSFGSKTLYDYKNDKKLDYEGGHAMLVLGYTQSNVIVLNSWGEGFGQKGICYFDWKLFEKSCFSAWAFSIE